MQAFCSSGERAYSSSQCEGLALVAVASLLADTGLGSRAPVVAACGLSGGGS